MKKIFTAVLAAASLSVAAQQNLIHIIDADDGDRLLMDVASFRVINDNETKMVFIGAKYHLFSNGELQPAQTFFTTAATCGPMSGLLIRRDFENGQWKTGARYFWSKDGDKLYDAIGASLCGGYAGLNELKQNSTTPKNSNKNLNI